MRWAFPFIAAAITFGLSLIGAPHASGHATVPMRHDGMLRLAVMPQPRSACGLARPPASGVEAMRQAAVEARWNPASVWTGVLVGTPDNPLAAAWRGFIDYSKGRETPVAGRAGCTPASLATG